MRSSALLRPFRVWQVDYGRVLCLLTGLLYCFLTCASAQTKPTRAVADTVLVNARIYTLNPHQPWAEALAIRDGQILAVGTAAEIKAYQAPASKVIDGRDHLVLPGFTDSHIHFLSGAVSLSQVDLTDASTAVEIQQRVKEYAAAHPGHGWILGRGWVYSAFGAVALPDKKYLDEVLPDRPALLEAYDGHTYWANSRALALAGITRDTRDPPNGTIVRDSRTGEPTGALKEEAARLVERVAPQPTRREKLDALRRGFAEANRNGLVRVHSAGGDFDALDLYDELRRQGLLTLRLSVAYFLDPPHLTAQVLGRIEKARRRFNDAWLACGIVKIMLDGVIESHTAAMLAPYADNSNQMGRLFWDEVAYREAVAELDRRGFQILTHAIGERAVRLALDSYQQAQRQNASSNRRHRIEHIETLSAEDESRFGQLGVIASFQPLHAYPDRNLFDVWARNAGPEREPRAFAWQGVAATGGRLAFGSDWPVVTLNPWAGIQTAVTRQSREGNPPGGWVPEQRVSLGQAIEAYTLGAAIAGRRETVEGSLEPGKLADLIVVAPSLFAAEPGSIGKTRVLLTMVGGRVVFEFPEWRSSRAAKTGEKGEGTR